MIATKTVAEIQRLLSEGKLSQRKIALLMGVSRGSVGAIASGKRPDHATPQEPGDDELEEPAGPPQRCADCGGLVYVPCRLCRQRARLARAASRGTVPFSSPTASPRCPRKLGQSPQGSPFESEERPAFNLRPEHQARYKEVRRWRREHQGQRIRGRRRRANRPTLIICDDLQNDAHSGSAMQREHSRSWFHGTLMKAGVARTNVVNLATALHREALAMELHRTPGWTSRLFKSIVRWPRNTSLWEQWEAIYTDLSKPRYKEQARAFYEQHRHAMNAGAIVLWPEVEDLYTLMCMRVESGRTAFEREKQNSPINPDQCEWPESYFDETIWFETWPTSLVVKTMALDPSKGSDARRGDYSALVMLGVDRQGMLYVEADLARRPTPQIVADATEWFRRFQPDLFGVESNQFQDLLAGEFEVEFRRQGILGPRPVPIENHTAKQVRIRRLGPYLSSRRVRFKTNSPCTRLLVEQLGEFPIGDHDDGPDALEMALRLAVDVLHGRTIKDGLGNRLPVGQ